MNKHVPADDLPNFPEIAVGTYQHYKGKLYNVVGVCVNTESLEPLVLYPPLYDSKMKYWVQPYSVFTGEVFVDGKPTLRFQKLENKQS